MSALKVDVIMLSYTKDLNYYNMTKNAITSLHNSEVNFSFNVHLIETNIDLFKEFPEGYEANVIMPNIPFNYNKFINIGLKHCTNNYIVMCNNDVTFEKGWFTMLTKRMKESNAVSASPHDGTMLILRSRKGRKIHIPEAWEGYEISKHVLGHCIVATKEVLDKVEFDERFIFWGQDDDYAKQLQYYGFKHILAKDSIVKHIANASHKLLTHNDIALRNQMRNLFDEKWKGETPFIHKKSEEIKPRKDTAIFVHLSQYELWDVISDKLKKTDSLFSIYVNLVDGVGYENMEKKILTDFPLATVIISKDKGLDGSKILLINEWIKDEGKEEYLIFLHSHYEDLFEIISPQNINSIKDCFSRNASLGMVENGGMFWARLSVYREYFKKTLPFAMLSELENVDAIFTSENIFRYLITNKGYKICGIRETMASYGINMVALFETSKGISEVPRQISSCLDSVKIPLIKIDETKVRPGLNTPYYFNLLSCNADQTPRVSSLLDTTLGNQFFKNKYTIGFWFWELLKFPKEWENSFNYVDEVWVASDFCREIFERISPNKPITKIPSPVVINTNISADRSKYNIDKDCFVFLFAFDCHSIFERKNPLAIVEAFKKTFTNQDNVKLIIKSSYLYSNPINKAKLYDAIKGYPILLIEEIIEKSDMMNLMAICDSYISLHRSEGYGLTLAEAMAFGKPCIATGFSGNLEFMNNENSYLVDYEMVELKQDFHPYQKGSVWANPNIDTATKYMRYVYDNREDSKKIGLIAKNHIETNFSYNAIGELIKKRLSTILNG